jgi:hypothetical protein
MNKGCNNCEHYCHGILEVYKSDIPHKCLIGNNKQMNNWWLENGHKTNKNDITDMECFKETKIHKLHNETLKILNELEKTIIDKK